MLHRVLAGNYILDIVDTLGLLLHAIVHSAGIQDRDGGIMLLATLFGQFPFRGAAAMSVDITQPIFTDEDKAREHLEAQRWPDGPFPTRLY